MARIFSKSCQDRVGIINTPSGASRIVSTAIAIAIIDFQLSVKLNDRGSMVEATDR
jgi:hypothetical protein